MITLTNRDIDLLLQSLDALESSQAKTNTLTTLMGAMLQRSEQERDAFLRKREQEEASEKLLLARRNEELILLKARLIQMRPREEDGA